MCRFVISPGFAQSLALTQGMLEIARSDNQPPLLVRPMLDPSEQIFSLGEGERSIYRPKIHREWPRFKRMFRCLTEQG